jgi:hypothetical protein
LVYLVIPARTPVAHPDCFFRTKGPPLSPHYR